jgi:hypothetical protein
VVVWVQVVLASHNVASVRRAIGTADALGLARKDERLQFAQLKVSTQHTGQGATLAKHNGRQQGPFQEVS